MNTNDMNELIDRYLDHVATPDETTELLDAMAADPALRAEFQTASTIKQVFDQELAATALPEDLYAAIVSTAQSAGALPPLATATTATTAASGAGIAGTAITSAIASFLGVMSAITVGVSIYTNAGRLMLPAAPLAATSTVATGTPTSNVVPPNIPFDHGHTITRAAANPMRMVAVPSAPSSIQEGTRHRSDGAQSQPDATLDLIDATHANGTHIEIDHPMAADPEHPAFSSISHQVNSLPIELRLTSAPVVGYSYNSNASSSMPSLGLELDYRLSDEHAMGVNLHRDIMPMQVVSGGIARSNQVMTWGGIHYRYMPSIQLPLELRPTVQLSLGGSSMGAVAMPTIGLHRTFDNLSLGLGADLLAFASQHQGAWQVATRTALRVEMGYRW